MHTNRYTFIYAIVLSVITAVLLAFASEGLRPAQEANIALDKKTSILRSVRIASTDRKVLEQTYAERVKELVVNSKGEEISDVRASDIVLKDELEKPVEQRRLPLYVFTGDDSKKRYIVPMSGVGLWGPIWGYVSIEEDFNTVYGAFFDHKSETPGLGAEIAEKPFQEQFQGKKIMGSDNNFVSVHVMKKAAKSELGPEHRVDGISGGTITSNGTDKMIRDWLEPYLGWFGKMKGN
ncbi:MAG: NADH:ubiquinone reductase (Na(+)-transporting) subunit C [Haliscomenobacteraceae bacterium CHB4]|nr:Na(+)-translocating NADH-quinone reductase subunit C [Saprospiraceae bacterium]MCE7923808.1 NADH:ubiquinone reductase (Na(+)-transporting) subunit C [Haliscomenobacteraceae bacterium CHB4]